MWEQPVLLVTSRCLNVKGVAPAFSGSAPLFTHLQLFIHVPILSYIVRAFVYLPHIFISCPTIVVHF